MTIRKILSLCLALALTLCGISALAEEDLQAQLDAANARIAELEALVDTYYPVYIAQVVATYGEDGVVWLTDVQAQYEAISSQYQSMGLSLEAYGMADSVKHDIVVAAVENGVLLDKAAELGLDQFDEDAMAEIEAETDEQMDQYVDAYASYFFPDAEEITDDMRAEALDYWAENGIEREGVLENHKRSAALEAVRDYATQDVTVSEEDVQAAYEALIAANQESYANDRTYNSDRNAGVAIAWNPEGYRAVKHVLIKFDDEQAQRYSELQSQLDSLQAERDAIVNPTPEPTEAPAEEADAAEDEAEPAATEAPAQRSLSEVDTDIAACASEREALYAQLLPKAQEVIDAFNGGTDFDELVEKYNEDPGMQSEPTASIGYAVSASSTTWEQAFTDGAMSIANVGEISAPVYGSNGIHIIYYMGDITPGTVPLDEIRDSVIADAEDEKNQAAYDAQLDAWVADANVVYHFESFGLPAEETPADLAKDEAAEEIIEEAEEEPTEQEAEEALESAGEETEAAE